MSIIELSMIAIGLAMDAFAVSVCKGLNMRKVNYRHGFIYALSFGFFQAMMPFIGWFLGKQFEQYITSIDHWIAFILLVMIGFNMIKESLENDCDTCKEDRLDIKELLMLSIATSIDALAVGITFAFLKVTIIPAVSLIGIITLVISFVGILIGNRFGIRYKSKAEVAGGIILILMGIKILLEHLGILVLAIII